MSSASEKSTVLLEKKVIDLLKKVKDHPRETYNETIESMAKEKLLRKTAERVLKAKEVFGLLKDWKRPTEEIIADARKGWD